MEKENKIPRCKGSFKVGTACGLCERCKARGYTLEDKAAAKAAEAERTKDLPPNRVKTEAHVARRTEEQRQRDKEEIKDEVKDELKPEMKEEIKDELRPEISEEIEEKVKEEKEKPVDPAPVDPSPVDPSPVDPKEPKK